MDLEENRHKKRGLIGTVFVHIFFLILFLFTGISYKIPPDPKGGIVMDFSINQDFDEAAQSTSSEIKEEVVSKKKFY